MSVATKPLQVFGDPVDERALKQIQNCLEHDRAVEGALMADHHLGYSMPIGGVVVYEDAISPSGVGYDIACGNMCVKTDVLVSEIRDDKAAILKAIQERVAFGVGRRNKTPVDHPLFGAPVWAELELQYSGLKEIARAQLGTVGSGNHYVDLLEDDEGTLWVANHFGSRGFGHKTATGFLNLARGEAFDARLRDSEEPTVLEFGPGLSLGEIYFQAMQLAGEYAYAGREYVIGQVLEIVGGQPVFTVHNHHNFAWIEDGRYVVRKGATPLTREPAFIGGSMGDDSVIVRGAPTSDTAGLSIPELSATVEDIGALGSAPHGAGRFMSRTRAAGKMRNMRRCNIRDCDRVFGKGEICTVHPEAGSSKFRARDTSTAEIDWLVVRGELASRGIEVLGAGADEAPGAYKRLDEVLAQHANVEVLHRLSPIGVVMAGDDTYDPYKD